MTSRWSQDAAAYLLRTTTCPRCNAPLQAGVCTSCGADLRGDIGAELATASRAAADAVLARQGVIDRIPVAAEAAQARQAAPATAAVTAVAAPEPAARRSSQVSVQSVLAVAGAALIGVAAIVFTYLDPNLDVNVRDLVIAGVTVLFALAAILLGRIGLRFSSEAIGALGMVFLALVVGAFANRFDPDAARWLTAGVGTIVAAAAALGFGTLLRLRTWVWAGLVGLSIAPAMFGYAGGDWRWAPIAGHVGVVAATLGADLLASRLGPRFGGAMQPERWTLTVLRLAATATVVAQLLIHLWPLPMAERWVGTSITVLVLGVLVLIATRGPLGPVASFAGAVLATTSLTVLPLAVDFDEWWIALAPAGAAVMLAVLSALRLPASVQSVALRMGSMLVLAVSALPAVFVTAATALRTLAEFAGRFLDRDGDSEPVTGAFVTAASLGLLAGAAGLAVGAFATARGQGVPLAWRRPAGLAGQGITTFSLAAAGWAAAGAAVGFAGWPLHLWLRIAIGLVLAAGIALAFRTGGPGAAIRPALRAPALLVPHVLLPLAAMLSWIDRDPVVTLVAGVGVLAALVAVSRVVPPAVRWVHTAIGFAYALVLVVRGLQVLDERVFAQAGPPVLGAIAIVALTATAALLTAIGATLLPAVPRRSWYAILAVAAVPFAIGIGMVIAERSGWTALSTAVAFALAITLLLSRRDGALPVIRIIGGALLVPLLAVLVVCLVPQLTSDSGSPIALPVIAVIVACTLPVTGLIGAGLQRRGIAAEDARLSRLFIEASALITGAIAVALALWRIAAGVGTAFLVLFIVGIGGAATAMIVKRRYGWWVAGSDWSGASWCLLWLADVTVPEPYILGPSLAAVLVGAALVLRGGRWMPLYAVGIACATLPTLALLAIRGYDGAELPWRTIGLLAASGLLIAVGILLGRWARTASLRVPSLLVAILAASAGTVQAIRWGAGADAIVLPDALVILPALGISALSAALAAAAAFGLRGVAPAQRWHFAPAFVLLAAGPAAAHERHWLPILLLLGLMLVLLAVMVLTARRARTAVPAVPPVWFQWVVAWCVGVAGWSERELRVEAFSVPLGLALLAAGVLHMVGERADQRRTLNNWPAGWRGSWPLLGPGIVATLLPSVLATFTDPRTERAILVMALAVIAVLVGAFGKLAAPFVLGIATLPLENIIVFTVQLAQGRGALPWWITLACAGAVLLAIAVTYERRSSGEGGVVARLRDLR